MIGYFSGPASVSPDMTSGWSDVHITGHVSGRNEAIIVLDYLWNYCRIRFLSKFSNNFQEILHTIFHSCHDYPEGFAKF